MDQHSSIDWSWPQAAHGVRRTAPRTGGQGSGRAPAPQHLRRSGEACDARRRPAHALRWLAAALLLVLAAAAWLLVEPAARVSALAGLGHRTQPADGATETLAGGTQRSLRTITLPAQLRLQGSDGQVRRLPEALFDGRPVVLTFMYSSCATVCPVTNQTLVAFEGLLGEEQARVHTVSVSIDPDHDTVRAMADYAARSGGRGAYYTSDPGTSEAVQRSFDVWRGDKMAHQPVFLLNTGAHQPWVRLDGLVTPGQLLAEYRRLQARPG